MANLRDSLLEAGYTVDGVLEVLGPLAYSALSRSESVPALRATTGGSPVETLIRLFLLQQVMDRKAVAAALPLADALGIELIEAVDGDRVRAAVDIRPYGDDDGHDWYLVSDLSGGLHASGHGHAVREDHVLGVGGASTTLAQLTIRDEFDSALDLGTGCGVQALHLSTHVGRVTATDRNARALRFAALTAKLSGLLRPLDLREGSLFDPVADERFDLIVSNPPFVVSPDSATDGGRFIYRDSGLPGDEVCRQLIGNAHRHLTENGWCQILANWLHVAGQDWRERVAGWVRDTGCDAWVVQREAQDTAEYVELWLRDSGEYGTPDYPARYDAWLDYFEKNKVEGVGFGWITLHNAGSDSPLMRLEEISHPVEQPLGPHIPSWFARHDFLRDTDDTDLLTKRFAVAPDVRWEQVASPTYAAAAGGTSGRGSGWGSDSSRIRQEEGFRRSADIDPIGAAVLGSSDGSATLGVVLDGVGARYGIDATTLRTGAIEAVRGLVEDGYLFPVA
jgi:methylase of polypeptide subunit release factors